MGHKGIDDSITFISFTGKIFPETITYCKNKNQIKGGITIVIEN